jgi:peptide/nickel transport system substrate-binding protein
VVRDKRLGWRFTAAASALALLATACGGGTDDSADPEEPVDGDEQAAGDDGDIDADNYCEEGGSARLRWAHEQEPPDMHLDDPANNLTATSWILQGMFEGLYGIDSSMAYTPELLAEEAEVDEGDDAVTYSFTLRDDLQWSDGEPITGETVQGTYDIIVDEAFAHSSKPDYELIDPESWEVDGQTFSFQTAEFFAGFPGLFNRLYPVHLLEDGDAANEALRSMEIDGEALPASGPFVWGEWAPGQSITLERNDDYHGGHPDNDDITNKGVACVEGVDILFVADTSAQVNAVRGGEADIVMPQPQVAFTELQDDPSVEAAPPVSAVFEHWSMNIHNVHLSDADVREALAYAIDKGVVMSELYTPIYGDALPAEGNGATYWLAGSDNYIDHQGDAGYGQGDLDASAELLEGAGYELNADDIYEHPERGPLTLRIATTGGNELRELQQQLLQNQLAEAGFDIEIDNRPGADHFTEQAFSPGNVACSVSQGDQGATVTLQSGEEATADCEVVDIVQFAWVGGPWPGGQNVAYRTGSENNPHGYSNPEVDSLMEQCDATVDDAERADCYHEIDRYVTTREVDPEGLIIIPLTVKPSFYAYSTTTLERAVTVVDANDAGPLVHGADYLPAG